MARSQRLEGGHPALWKSIELDRDRVKLNLMRLRTEFMKTSSIWEQSSKQRLTWKLILIWTLKESGLLLGGVQWVCLSQTLHEAKRKNISLVDDDRL